MPNQPTFSFFTTQPGHRPVPLPRQDPRAIWPSILLLTSLVILAFVRVSAMQRVTLTVQAGFSRQTSNKLERQESNPLSLVPILLLLVYVMNLSFVMFRANAYFHLVFVDYAGGLQYLIFAGLIVTMLLLRFGVNLLLGFVTDEMRLIGEYTSSGFILLQTFGLVLFPVVVLMEFSPAEPLFFLYTAIVLAGISVLIHWFRGLLTALSGRGVGMLQIFCYFCALEILPILVLVKFIIETF